MQQENLLMNEEENIERVVERKKGSLETDKGLNIHPLLKEKLELMIHRMENKGFDNFLVIDGKEGYGKTTLAAQICYYVSYRTGRRFTHEDIYFRVAEMLKEMQTSSSRIFLLDEAELDLFSEQRGKLQRYFAQLLMAGRKKNHFIIAIIPTIKKLKPFVVERAIGMIRVYSPDQLSRGYYAYYSEEAKNSLYEEWIKSRKLNYKKFYTFNGRFNSKFDEFINRDEYEKKKDEAIAEIGAEKEEDHSPGLRKLNKYQYLIWWLLDKRIINLTQEQFSKYSETSRETVTKWKLLKDKYSYIKEMAIVKGEVEPKLL